MVITTTSLSVHYPAAQRPALDAVDMELNKGECLLVSGPTGCGKSTLGLALCGAVPGVIHARVNGSISIDGHTPESINIREASRTIGFLLQNIEHQIFTDTVEDEIAFGLENFSIARAAMPEKISAALALIQAGHLAGRTLSTLSTGERQRVLCAAIAALGQPVLMLDEPLAYLDRKAQQRLLLVLRRLADSGASVLMFEHRRDIAHRVSDRELFMREGHLCIAEPPHTLFEPATDAPPGGEIRCAVDTLSFGYSPSPLFSELSFEVRAGESMLLLGDNGAGKTTLLSLVMGLLRPQSGTIRTCGMQVGRHAPRLLARKAAYLFQQPDHQLFCARVRDELMLQTTDNAAIDRELSDLALGELADRHPRSLSMGQKRRVTIAAALARKPALLLLDEPSVGQDDESLALVIRRLNRYVADGGALLCATHDGRVARALGVTTVVIENGKATHGGRELAQDYFEPNTNNKQQELS